MGLAEYDRLMARYRTHPVEWVERFLPGMKLAPYQRDILRSLPRHAETWVESANGVGKTMTAAIASLWFFLTRPGIVYTISPSQHQLEHSLWVEIRHLLGMIDTKSAGLLIPPAALEIRRLGANGKTEPRSYLVGKCVADTENLQGVHLPRLPDGTPMIMFVGEEGTGIHDRFWPVVRTSSHCTLVIANPIRTDGEFYRVTSAGPVQIEGKPHRNVIRVSGEQSPNVQRDTKLAEKGLPLPKEPLVPGILDYTTFLDLKATLPPWELGPRLYGRPNDQSTAKLFPKEWLDYGQQLYALLKAGAPDRSESVRRWLCWWGFPFGLGVDCAHGGGDLSAWVVYGRFGAVHVEVADTPNAREIKRRTLALMRRWKVKAEWVCFDRAIGGLIADELREEGMEVNDVAFGGGALDDRYPNMRVEMYGELAEAMGKAWDQQGKLRPGYAQLVGPVQRSDGGTGQLAPKHWRDLKKVRPVAIPDDADLRQELFVLPRAQDGKDRLTLPPKDGTKSKLGVKQMLGGRSPDRADSLVLARYAWERGQEYRRLSRVDGDLFY